MGTAATKDVATSLRSTNQNQILSPGFGGLSIPSLNSGGAGDSGPVAARATSGFHTYSGVDTANMPPWWYESVVWGAGIVVARNDYQSLELIASREGRIGLRVYQSPTLSKSAEIYTTLNTTKASDGTLKAASPVVKIFHDGRSETNGESEGCEVARLGMGQYLIKNCIGLNADAAWGGINGGFDIPKDRNGQPLVWLDFDVNADGSVLVQTYHRTYPNSPTFAQNIIEGIDDGEPVDIPADQFVSVRVEMPIDSIWNQKQAAIQDESEAL